MKNRKQIGPLAATLYLYVAFLLGFPNKAAAQEEIEILVVGSLHQNKENAEAYRPIIEKLKRFNPDMVMTEFMTPADQKEALELGYWGAKGFHKKYDYLVAHSPKAADTKEYALAKAYKSLDKFAYYHKVRMDLARDLYLSYDRGNAEYQLYILNEHMKAKFGKSEQAYFDKLFGPVDTLRKIGLLHKNSEYQKIYFPLAYELNHTKIYSMDVQRYDGPWSQAWAKADSLINLMNKQAEVDSTSPAGLAVKAIKTYYKDLEKRAGKIEFNSYEFLNSPIYGEIDAAMNFYGGAKFFDEPGFPAEPIKQMRYWWEQRNQAMCENTIRQAVANGARRVVVGVGASHRQEMEQIFAKMPNVKLIHFNDLP